MYSKQEIDELQRMIEDGNKASGGLQKSVSLFYGIVGEFRFHVIHTSPVKLNLSLGFTRFTAGWYIVVIKRRAPVALIGGHYVFHCEEVLIVPIDTKPDRTTEELRLLQAFQQVDLSKNFYFSYTYDITNTLQRNLTRPMTRSQHLAESSLPVDERQPHDINDKFVWNHNLLHSALVDLPEPSHWVLPIIHGFVDQASQYTCLYPNKHYVDPCARLS